MELKKRLLEHCWSYLENKQENLRSRRRLLDDSLQNETKSTVGDKHETGRAMVQLEQEKLGKQERDLEVLREILQRINIDKHSPKASLGSLVKTDSKSYFLGIFAGSFQQGDNRIFCISTASPIGCLLLGKSVGESYVFNGETSHILEIE